MLVWAESARVRDSQFIIISSTVDCGYKRAMGRLRLASGMKEMHNLIFGGFIFAGLIIG
jgi:hypothetical protein